MKKILALALVVLMALSTLTACNNGTPVETTGANTEVEVQNVKLGLGVYAYYGDTTSADGETNGSAEVVATVAAVLVDADGKIVKCDIDCADLTVGYTSAGEAVVAEEFLTKYELGNNYSMAVYGSDNNGDGIIKEWFEQIDIFEEAIVGKTIDEAKALVVNGYQAVEDVQTAGCTMGVGDYIKAVEKAYNNATESAANATDTLKVAVVTSSSATTASADAEGSAELDLSVAAVATADGKATACASDVLVVGFSFDTKGTATTDTAAELATKGEKGDNYGMAAYGTDNNGDGVVLEWYAQAAAFNAACLGKNADEIAALVVNGYQAVEDVQTAGCTMGVGDLAAAIVKAAK